MIYEHSELERISRYCGMRNDLIQASGGNTSIKIDDRVMLIKSSGVTLSELGCGYGVSLVDYRAIAGFMSDTSGCVGDGSPEKALRDALIGGSRPSIETFLHASTRRVTMHVHSICANALAIRNDFREVVSDLFPKAIVVDYGTPGIELAIELKKTLSLRRSSDDDRVIFLKNHGVVVSGDTCDEVISINEHIEDVITKWSPLANKTERMSTEIWSFLSEANELSNTIVYRVANQRALELFKERSSEMWEYRFCPDCIVFLGRKPYLYDEHSTIEDLRVHIAEYGPPALVIADGGLYICASNMKKAHEIEEVLAFSADLFLSVPEDKHEILTVSEQKKLLGLDSEKYRQQIK